MPHHPLAPISGNIPHRKELETFERVVIGFAANGVTLPQIATQLSNWTSSEMFKGAFGCNLEASDSVQNPLIRSDFACTASKI